MSVCRNLGELLGRSREAYRQRDLFGTRTPEGWRWLRYDAFAKLVDDLRAGLEGLGLRAGDRIAVISENRVEWAVAAFASFTLGAILVPIHPTQPADERRYVLQHSGARAVFVASPGTTTAVHAIAGDLPDLAHVIALDGGVATDTYRDLLNRGRERPVGAYPAPSHGVATLFYAPGSGGTLEGVPLSHGNILSAIHALHRVLPVREDDRSVAIVPWALGFAQISELFGMMRRGAAIAIGAGPVDPARLVADARPSVLFAQPRMLRGILERARSWADEMWLGPLLFGLGLCAAARRRDGRALDLVTRLGAKMSDLLLFRRIRRLLGNRLARVVHSGPGVEREVDDFLCALRVDSYPSYGLTEASGVVTVDSPDTHRPGSVGRPVPGTRVSIDESVSPIRGYGEVVVRGPGVMRAHSHHHPHGRAVEVSDDGALHTGDLGRVDDDGFVYLSGRIDEHYQLAKGEHVMPAAIEDALRASPYIANAFVYGKGQPHNVALLVLDSEAVRRWADEHGHVVKEVDTDSRVLRLVASEVKHRTESLAAPLRVRGIGVVRNDFSVASGLATPGGRLRRRRIAERYSAQLASLYTVRRKSQRAAE